jgi:hypothetical protein
MTFPLLSKRYARDDNRQIFFDKDIALHKLPLFKNTDYGLVTSFVWVSGLIS